MKNCIKKLSGHALAGMQYAEAVVSGEILASRLTQLACARSLKMFEIAEEKQWKFDVDAANRVCKFIELLPHIKGRWGSKTLVLEPWQCWILVTVFGWKNADGLRVIRTVYIEVPRKNAKALCVNTPIPTPAGWVAMGDIIPGDLVYAADGSVCKVTNVSPIYYGHKCYELVFSNGERIIADAGHQWLTNARVDLPGSGSRKGYEHGSTVTKRIRTTEELFNTQRYGSRNDVNHSVDMPGAINGDDVSLPIQPYTIGAWLGDGHSKAARITCHRDDVEIIHGISSDGWTVTEKSNNGSAASTFSIMSSASRKRDDCFQRKLKKANVFGNKHIPSEYLRASKAQRIALLQGLMDTDGTISKSGLNLSYTTTVERLATGVRELLASLGLKSSVIQSSMRCNGAPVPGVAYKVQFMAFRDEIEVFKLKRKLDRMLMYSDRKRAPRSKTVQIVSVSEVESTPVKCITVDSCDSLFLAGSQFIPTHNSTLSAGVALYMLAADDESGAEVYSAATTRDQAKITWDVARNMVIRTPGIQRRFGVSAMAHAVVVPEKSGTFQALSSEGGALDGLNVHCAVIDELHAHKFREVYDVIETATGSRRQPLLWSITTAGSNQVGICYEQRGYVVKLVENSADDWSYFGAIYTIDEGDDWTSEEAWRKANPNFNVSVLPDDMARLCQKAQQMPAAQANFLTKRLNVWVGADCAWLDMVKYDACADPSLDISDFTDVSACIGVDLASKTDFACTCLAAFDADGNLCLFDRHYLPSATVESTDHAPYQAWADAGYIVETVGPITDIGQIEDDLIDVSTRHKIDEIAYDPFQATQLATRLSNQGLPVVEFRQTVLNFSEAMKEIQARMITGRLRHNGNPVLRWMFSNVVAHLDNKDNIYPKKERAENKIDGVVAAIMATARLMHHSDKGVKKSIYEDFDVREV